MNLEIFKKAIKSKQSISFNYKKEGVRIGNPHALYNYTTKKGVTSTKIDIYQSSGYSSNPKQLPTFREFNIAYITDIELLNNNFEPSSDYNSISERYSNSICKL